MTTEPSLNIEDLRRVAEAATPGPWRTNSDHSVKSYEPGHWAVADASPCRKREANAKYIATFDPPTVLSLLNYISSVEADRDEAKRFLALRDRQIELSGRMWQRDAEEALAGKPQALRNRIEMRKLGPVEIIQSAPQALSEPNAQAQMSTDPGVGDGGA